MMETLPPLDDAMNLCDLKLKSGLQNSLRRHGLRTVGDVRGMRSKRLLALSGIGARSIEALRSLGVFSSAANESLHYCEGETEYARYGTALNYCEEQEDGTLWVGNGEYASQVSYCPYCGYRAPTPAVAKPACDGPPWDDEKETGN